MGRDKGAARGAEEPDILGGVDFIIVDDVGEGGIDKGCSEGGRRLNGGISMSSMCSISSLLFRGPALWGRADQRGDLTQLRI